MKIEVLDITLPLDYGWIGATPNRGPLWDLIPEFRTAKVKIIDQGVVFKDKVIMPLRPMIGRIGLAPKDGPLASNDKGEFGGGMGNSQIAKGATVYLPAFHDGGLLTIGDCHAAMGDGEATASAVECALDATFRVTISDDFQVTRPVVATGSEVMTTGEGATMEEAAKGALNAMADLMVDRLAIDYTDAAMLIASAADVRTGLAGNPPYTMRAAIPRSMLSV